MLQYIVYNKSPPDPRSSVNRTKCQRDKGPEAQGDLRPKIQLRNHEPMTKVGVPDVVVRQVADVDPEPARIEADARNEESVVRLEQEECTVPISAKPLAVLLHEVLNLPLSETH